jgi:hypothetical protein
MQRLPWILTRARDLIFQTVSSIDASTHASLIDVDMPEAKGKEELKAKAAEMNK